MIAAARFSVVVACGLLVAGCSLFGGGKDDEVQPNELITFDETFAVKKLWSAKVGGDAEFLRLALLPAGDGTRIYAAGRDGDVSAFDPASGKRLWRVETDAALSAGPGVGEGKVVVAGSDGILICLSAEKGNELWRRTIAGESLAVPVVNGDAVVISTIDGKLRVLSAFDGSERWSTEQTPPPLTLRGSAAPVIVGTTIIAGFDNGRLIAIKLEDGTTEWEAMLSPPSGRSDLERLSDVDGSITAVGQDVYATGYQGRLAALAAESGQILWARELSAFTGVSADWNNVYTTNAEGEIVAMLRRSGSEAWRQDALLRREPTVPVAFQTTVSVGDFEGYVHFFSNVDGRPVARRRVDNAMISAPPVAIGGRLYVQTDSGVLAAFGVPEQKKKAAATDGTTE